MGRQTTSTVLALLHFTKSKDASFHVSKQLYFSNLERGRGERGYPFWPRAPIRNLPLLDFSVWDIDAIQYIWWV